MFNYLIWPGRLDLIGTDNHTRHSYEYNHLGPKTLDVTSMGCESLKEAATLMGYTDLTLTTVDIGSKSFSSDHPFEHRFHLIQYPGAKTIQQSEEHGVVKLNRENPDVGQFVLASPCDTSTVAVKFPFTNVINEQGHGRGSFNHTA